MLYFSNFNFNYLEKYLQTTVEELVAATAYFDLFLRSVTDPGLLRSFIRFLLEDNYDDCRILDSLIQRISSRSRVNWKNYSFSFLKRFLNIIYL